MLVITLLDGSKRYYENFVSIIQVAKDINIKLYKICVAGIVNDNLLDSRTLIKKNSKLEIITSNDKRSLKIIRNSCAHLLGYAIKKIWPQAIIAQGSNTTDGFYYDIENKYFLKKKDLYKIEQKMLNLSCRKYNIINKQIKLKKNNKYKSIFQNKYKKEILKYNKKYKYIYFHENHIDISNYIQAPNIKFCKYFKLSKLSGAYWNNNSSNKMLQRIYGTAWLNKKTLDKYLKKIKEIKKRDHRKISKTLDLYHIQKESPGVIFWHKNGLTIFRQIKKLIREKLQFDYEEVQTPLLMNREIWEKTGHWENYHESIFTTSLENNKYCIKPMNCPAHIDIFKKKLRSYKELPIRISEFGVCHRKETSGALHGLMRARSFTQDDAHIFCSKNQIRNEIEKCIKLIYDVYNIFGFKKIFVKFSTRPKKRIGTNEIWDQAEHDLLQVLLKNKIKFEYQLGEGAFYGPKIEIILKDSLKRMWQCGTIQLDFYLPSRLNAFYINKENKKKTPIIIHRAILGSIERFIGILSEEYNGKFPLWISPIQIVVMSISKKHNFYVKKIFKIFLKNNLRTLIDIRNEKIGLKIREYTLKNIPYMIICGDKEINNDEITIRNIKGNYANVKNINIFIKEIKKEINKRVLL
ncbi:threonine--tRNA ligase [Buchnera aphidicola (Taiwanaphis decaspermi)]|uniref:threonine--tRNA ligase n=1 Tax=Buchnera aphidicola TaxID=9 RepID=UPI0031B83400